jgi:MFS transporter, DHA1 family, multidrug resistance protein
MKNKTWIFILIILLGAFPPLSTDMYLPALPNLCDLMNTSRTLVNLTLIIYFVVFGFLTLLWGPLSDKFGRKPTLLIGLAIYILSIFLCGIASNIESLIIYRIFQALGSAAPVAISMAIAKDVFDPKERIKVLAIISALMMIAPIIAPIIGGFILSVSSWNFIFIILAGFGVICFIGVIGMAETKQVDSEMSIVYALLGIARVLKKVQFTLPLLLFSLITIPLFAFIAGSSYIFVNGFHLSEQVFSMYFAINALFVSIGPILYLRLEKIMKINHIIVASFAMTVLSGALIIIFGPLNPIVFLAMVIPGTLAGSILRPPSSNILLELGGIDAGASSSLISFSVFSIGGIGMIIISIQWLNPIIIYGILALSAGALCLLFWKPIWNLITKNNLKITPHSN